MFSLKTETSQLSSANGGVGDMKYVQCAPTRDVTGTNFPNGSQYYKFSTNGRKWWVPKRSYMRMRIQLTGGAGAKLGQVNDVAPAMNIASTLFQSMEFKINGQVVSRVSDYVPQIDTLHKRLTKSKAWLDSTGASSCFLQPKYQDRQKQVISLGKEDKAGLLVDIASGQSVGAADLGTGLGFITAPNTIQFVAAGQEIRFTTNGGNPIPDLTKYLKIGQTVTFTNNGAEKIGTISGFESRATLNDTLVIANTIPAIVDAGVANYAPTLLRVVTQSLSQSRGMDAFEVIWQPALSIFNVDHALPAGDYELVLNPQNSNVYKLLAVESMSNNRIVGADAASNFQLNIVDAYLYVCEVEGPRVDNATYYLDLDEINCQRRDLQAVSGLAQQEFMVSPSTYALTLAFQDSRAGASETRYSSSKFKINPHGEKQDELKLQRMFLKYAGMNKPQPDADPKYKITSAEDYTVQRYSDSILYSGSYFSAGGAETIQDWHERGAYYHFAWPKEQSDRSTRVNANYDFSEAITNGTVLLFSHFKKAGMIRIENGIVREVKVEEM